jgi:hypothetical protein
MPEMAPTGMSKPGFSIPVLLFTITLTLVVDVPAGYDAPLELIVTEETAVLIKMFEFRYNDVSDVSPLITWEPVAAVT